MKRIWDLGYTFAFTKGRWREDIITGREGGILGLVEIAIDTASTAWERKKIELMAIAIKLRRCRKREIYLF